ncbi:MAG: carbohydrate ABC transporter permease [Lachnospirales bacterium]
MREGCDFLSKKYKFSGWSMILIATLMILIFAYIPMIQAFILSLKTGKGVNLSYAGIENYKRLFTDAVFIETLKNTIIYTVHIPIMLLFSLIFAVILNDNTLKFRGIYRTCIFLPCVTAPVSYAILFKNLFAVDGLVNKLLITFGLIETGIPFVLDAFWGKILIIIALVWKSTGYYMIFYLSALQNIDKSVYEAGKIDGANSARIFTSITMPLLKPIIFLTSIMALNSTLQIFDEVVNLTNGGPGNATMSISQYIYNLSFVYVPNYGYAAAVSYIVLVIVILLTIVQKKFMKEE